MVYNIRSGPTLRVGLQNQILDLFLWQCGSPLLTQCWNVGQKGSLFISGSAYFCNETPTDAQKNPSSSSSHCLTAGLDWDTGKKPGGGQPPWGVSGTWSCSPRGPRPCLLML
ncbi:hypothetical protein XENTR_v10003422 [Xenopus tropicalis]|nr:hypothetical protein XENTR_v10003422 [Xenopus tropicalis]